MTEARLVTREQLAALRELVRACETREPLDELRVRNLALTARYNLAALPAAVPAEGLPWRYYYDTYEKGTVFIATDPDTIIADDLPYEKGKALVDAHNAALARHESAGDGTCLNCGLSWVAAQGRLCFIGDTGVSFSQHHWSDEAQP